MATSAPIRKDKSTNQGICSDKRKYKSFGELRKSIATRGAFNRKLVDNYKQGR